MEDKQLYVLCGGAETSIEEPFIFTELDSARVKMRTLWKDKIDSLTEDDIEESGFDEYKAYVYTQDNTYTWEIFKCRLS